MSSRRVSPTTTICVDGNRPNSPFVSPSITVATRYNVYYLGDIKRKIKVTDDSRHIDKFINKIHSKHNDKLVVGLRLQPGILKLSFGHHCLIITRLAYPLPPLLKNFLENDNKDYTFVGVDVNSLEKRLAKYFGIRLRSVIDLGHLSSIKFDNNSLCGADLKTLAKKLLDKDINEQMNIVNTREGVMPNEEEIRHLCEDCFVLHEICSCLGIL